MLGRDAVALGGGDEIVRRDDLARSRRACAAAARSARPVSACCSGRMVWRNSSKRPSSSAVLMRAAHCISRRRRIRSMSFSSKLCTRLRPASLAAWQALSAARQHRGHVRVVGGDRHHADARAQAEDALLPGEPEVAHRLAQRLGRAHRLIERAALEQYAELIAAQARERVAPAHLGLEQRADLAEQRIAGAVAAGVVDDLELIDDRGSTARRRSRAPWRSSARAPCGSRTRAG